MSAAKPTVPASAKPFAVAPASTWVGLWIWLPLAGTVALVVGAQLHSQRTSMDLGITLAFVLLVCAALTWAFFRRRIVLHDDALEVVATFYRKRVPLGSMDLERARIVDLAEHTELKPGMKINGFGMPGFQSGHYRTGSRKTFCLVTDSSRVLYVPLRDGSALLISPENPRALLDALNTQVAR